MTNDYRDLLHRPGRANCMEDIEQHLNEAAGLARVMWSASHNEDAFSDKRDRDAFERLASVLADQVTAALYPFYTNEQKCGGGK